MESSSTNLLTQLPDMQKHFKISKMITSGAFGNVFLASSTNVSDNKQYAIKYVIPTYQEPKIITEFQFLDVLRGKHNVVSLIAFYKNNFGVALVMPYFPSDSFGKCVRNFTIDELKKYMKNLLIALEHVHSYDIIHRDIKPLNFLYNRKESRFLLIDFGLSHYSKNIMEDVIPGIEMIKNGEIMDKPEKNTGPNLNVTCNCTGTNKVCVICVGHCKVRARRGGTRGFRAPEVLLKHLHQTTAIDIWSAGVIMLSVMTKTYPLFKSQSDIANLLDIIQIFGMKDVRTLATKIDRTIISNLNHRGLDLRKFCEQISQKRFAKTKRFFIGVSGESIVDADVMEGNKGEHHDENVDEVTVPAVNNVIFPDDAYHLLKNLLRIDPDCRYSATQALQHPFLMDG